MRGLEKGDGMERRPITRQAIDRAVLASERVIEAPDFEQTFTRHTHRVVLREAVDTLLWQWGQMV